MVTQPQIPTYLDPMMNHKRTIKILSTMIAAATLTTEVKAAIWNVDADGSWSVASNWSGGVPTGTDAVADINFNITANRTVTLDSPRTIGTIRFQDATTASNDWTVASSGGGTLTLDVTSGAASIQVLNRTATLTASILGNDGISVTNGGSGGGTLVLNASNSFTNQLTIGTGVTVQTNTATALGIGGAGNETVVQAGGTLNINGQNLGTTEVIRIAGTGVGGLGALVNNGGGQNNALNTVTLTANATVGGAARFDIRNGTPLLDLAGFRLTKIGTNQFSVVGGSVTSGMIDVNAGILHLEGGVNVSGPGLISVNSGGTLGLFNNTGTFTRSIALNGGTLSEISTVTSSIASDIALTASSTINVTSSAANLTLAGNFTEAVGNTSITKTGAGTLTLNGVQGYTGALNVNAGTVALGAGSSLLTKQISVGDGAVLNVAAIGGYTIGAGGSLTVGRSTAAAADVLGAVTANTGATLNIGANSAARTATFGNGLTLNSAEMNIDLGSTTTAGAGVNDLAAIMGDLTAAGANRISIRPIATSLAAGNYTLATYGGTLTGSAANLSVVNASNFRQTFTIDTTTTAGTVLLNVAGGSGNLTWVGDGGTNTWNVNGATNWTDGAAQKFFDLDTVTFDDSGSATPAVNIIGPVTPGGLTVSSGQNYTFGGAGRITGATGLEKSGAGRLTVASAAHDFTGAINVTGGTISGASLPNGGTASSFGSGSSITLNGGTLEYTGTTAGTNRTFTLGGSNGTISVADKFSTLNLTTAIAGTGSLVKEGAGILRLDANVAFTGNITVNGGVLRPNNNQVLQTKTITVNSGGTFDPNGQNASGSRPVLNIVGNGAPGQAAIFNTGGGVSDVTLYSTLNFTGDAYVGGLSRYDFAGTTATPLAINGGEFTLTKVGTNESFWNPAAGASIGKIVIESGRFAPQSTNNLGSLNHTITVNPGGELGGFGAQSNAKPLVFNGGGILNQDNGNAQTWTGGVTVTANSSLSSQFQGQYNTNNAAASGFIFNNANFSLGGFTLTKLGRQAISIRGATAGTGDGTIDIYGGVVTFRAGTVVDGAGAVRMHGDGGPAATASLDDTGGVITFTKDIELNGGMLANTVGSHSLNAAGQTITIGGFGFIFNNAAGTTLTLGDLLVPTQGGVTFGTTGTVALTTINGSTPTSGTLSRAYTAGLTVNGTSFASWNGTAIVPVTPTYTTSGTLPANLSSAAAAAEVLATHTAGGVQVHNTITANLDIGSLIAEREVAVNNGALLRIGTGGLIIRANNSAGIVSQSANVGQLTSGAGNGELNVTVSTPFETNNAHDLKLQIVDNPGAGGAFTPVTLVKHGPGGLTGLGVDAQGTVAIRENTYTGGTVINSGRVPIVSSMALGTGNVTVRDGGQLAFFAAGNAGGAFLANNLSIAGLGVGEGGSGYSGAVRLGGLSGTPGVIGGNVKLTALSRIHNQNTANATIAGVISGAADLQYTGSQVSIFANPANTYTCSTSIGTRDAASAGALQVAKLANGGIASSLGASSNAASSIILMGGTLRYVGTGDNTDRLFTLGSAIAVNSVPTHTIDAAGYGGLNFTNTGTIGLLPGTSRTLQLTGTLINGAANTVNGAMPANTFAPVLGDPNTGVSNLQKGGQAKWILTGNHTYSGTTTVSDGILQLGDGGTTGSVGTGAISLQNNGDLVVNRSDTFTLNNVVTANATAGNEPEVVQIGTGTLIIGGASDNASTRLRVETGTLILGKVSTAAAHAVVFATTVNGGTLRLGGSGGDQIHDGFNTTVQMNGGVFDTNGRDEGIPRIEGSGGVVRNDAAGTLSTLTLGVGNSSSVVGVGTPMVDGAGTLAITKTGTGSTVLVGANTYSGPTTISQGRLVIGNNGTTGQLGTGIVNVATGASLVINRADNVVLANTVSGNGSLVQSGTGTTTLNAPKSYFGATVVNRGVLETDLTVSNNILPVSADLQMNGGRVKFVSSGATPASQSINGNFIVAGGDIELVGGASGVTVNLPSAWIRQEGGTVNFAISGVGTVATALANANGVAGLSTAAYATLNGIDWATQSASILAAFSGYADDIYAAPTHTNVTSDAAFAGPTVTSTLRFNTSSAIDLSLDGQTLALAQGGILITPNVGANATTISGGTLTGAAATGSEVIVHQHNSTAATISAVIANNGANTGLTKAGNGTLILAGANSYTGDTHVNQGTLQVGNGATNGALGSGNIYTDATVAFNRSDTVTVNNAIGGSGQVVNAGTGTTKLGGTNTFSGGLVVSKGTVTSDTNIGFGTGLVTLGDANTGVDNVALLSDFGADFANPIVVSASGSGSVIIGSASSLGTNPAIFSGNIVLNRATTFQGTNTDRTTYTGVISGTADLTFTAGRTTLEANNTFAGNVIVETGAVLQPGTGLFSNPRNQIPDSSSVTLNGTGALQLFGDSEVISSIQSTSDTSAIRGITGPSVLTITNGGTFNGSYDGGGVTIESTGGTLNIGGINDNPSSRFLVNGGTLVLGKASGATVHAAALDITVNSGTVRLGGSGGDQIWDGSTTSRTAMMLNGGHFDLAGQNEDFSILDGFGGIVTNSTADTTSVLTLGTNNWSNSGYAGTIQNGAGTVALTKTGTGGLILTGTNTFTGNTTISGGILQLGNGSVGGSIASANIINSGTLVTNHANDFVVFGGISGSGRFVQNGSGKVTLTGNNTYTGVTAINDGTLEIGNGGVSGLLGTGNVTNFGALRINHSDDLLLGNTIAGTGAVQQNGTGKTTLSAFSAYTGATLVNSGTLLVTGSIGASTVSVNSAGTLGGTGVTGAVNVVGGTIAPGVGIGTLSTGALSLNSLSTVKFELAVAGTVGSGINDLLSIGGNLTLDGTLQVTEMPGFTEGTYRLANYTGILTNNVLGLETSFLTAHPGSSIDTSIANQVNLVVVPEPASLASLLAGLGVLFLRRKRGGGRV